MEVACPQCGLGLAINEPERRAELAVCRSCGNAWLCEQGKDAGGNETLLAYPLPKRVHFRQDDDGFTISASIFQPAAIYILMLVVVTAYLSIRTAMDKNWIEFIFSALGLSTGIGMCLEWILGRFRFAVHGDTVGLDEGHSVFHHTKEFAWSDVVSADDSTTRLMGMHRIVLEMADGQLVYLGEALPDNRRRAVIRLLRYMLQRRG
ncbi:MAG: hypothetical protein JXL80_04090 [Planctomycetes bacterium]|nr:hypothetical protein [Planctomycetota bacterium]